MNTVFQILSSLSLFLLPYIIICYYMEKKAHKKWVKILEDKHKVLEVNLWLQIGNLPSLRRVEKEVKNNIVKKWSYDFNGREFETLDEAINFIRGWTYEAHGYMNIETFKTK